MKEGNREGCRCQSCIITVPVDFGYVSRATFTGDAVRRRLLAGSCVS